MEIVHTVSLAPYTTLKVGGVVDTYIRVKSRADLAKAFEYIRAHHIPYMILGGGSNVLAGDTCPPGGVVLKNELKGVTFEDTDETRIVRAIVASGEVWDDFVLMCVDRNYGGVENLSYIPGTVGGVPIQNVGAYGVEAKEVIEWVEIFDPVRNEFRELSSKECNFTYRESVFKRGEGSRWFITKVSFLLARTPLVNISYRDLTTLFETRNNHAPSLREVRDAVGVVRGAKFPDLSTRGTAGSFFKNPIISHDAAEELKGQFPGLPVFVHDKGKSKIALAWLFDNILKLKGYRRGRVALHDTQPIVLVTEPGATAEEIISFVEEIKVRAYEELGILIEQEVSPMSFHNIEM